MVFANYFSFKTTQSDDYDCSRHFIQLFHMDHVRIYFSIVEPNPTIFWILNLKFHLEFNVDSVYLILSSTSWMYIFKFPHEPTHKLFLHSYNFFFLRSRYYNLFFALITLFITNIFINNNSMAYLFFFYSKKLHPLKSVFYWFKWVSKTPAVPTIKQPWLASEFFLYNSNDKTSISNELAAQQQWLALMFPPIYVSLTIKKFQGISA
jgi:hypothetical protein